MDSNPNPRVVYLFGAGASAQALPMVSGIPKELSDHHDWLWKHAQNAGKAELLIPNIPASERSKILSEYLTVIDDIKVGSANHESIDTYAKKLYLRGRTIQADRLKLRDLKMGLSYFMAYLQARKGPDKRYDGFLASLLTHTAHGGLKLPSDVLILNWNYDQQLALAFSAYQRETTIADSIQELGMLPLELLPKATHGTYRAVHLNGMFAYRSNFDDAEPLFEFNTNDETARLSALLSSYARIKYGQGNHTGRMLLRFAWERDNSIDAAFDLLGRRLSHCEALVVIGYSFPFFNRSVDRELIKYMPQLRRVYVQAPPKATEEVARTVQTMQLPERVKVELYGNVDKFFLPPEL